MRLPQAAPVLTLLFASTLASGADPRPVAVLWKDPGPVSSKDFVNGPGGRAHVPKPPFRFLKEDEGGTSPKVKVRDGRGRTWIVKFGPEVKSDTFAPRLAWAAGYFVAPTYYVPRGTITGVRGLGRAASHIHKDGRFEDARFKLMDSSLTYLSGDGWKWKQNPFTGTRELSGLRILMMLTSNWDAKDARDDESNTAILAKSEAGRMLHIYSFDDWGSSMGKWGSYFVREKWDCEGFRKQSGEFVKGVKYGNVGWGYSGKHENDVTGDIPVEHVRWIQKYLGRVTDAQIRAGLRASGATPHEVRCFSQSLRVRLNELRRVGAARTRNVALSRR